MGDEAGDLLVGHRGSGAISPILRLIAMLLFATPFMHDIERGWAQIGQPVDAGE